MSGNALSNYPDPRRIVSYTLINYLYRPSNYLHALSSHTYALSNYLYAQR